MNYPIDISNVALKTKRLTLRPWKIEDLDDFYEYAKVPGVGEMAGWPHHKNKEESLKILTKFIENKKTFAVEYNNKVIGSLGIEEYDYKLLPECETKRGREIGFVLSKNYWGLGLMTEAVNAVIKYLFEIVKLDFIVCSHMFENIKSCRVQEKCGFKHYKTFKYETRFNTIRDSWLSILENKNKGE